jgi:hypothetical protein
MESATSARARPVPPHARSDLLPVARKVFWWGEPNEWLDDAVRFVAQVMTYGDLEDIRATVRLLGESVFLEVLDDPPTGVFDPKSWVFWQRRYRREVRPLPRRVF